MAISQKRSEPDRITQRPGPTRLAMSSRLLSLLGLLLTALLTCAAAPAQAPRAKTYLFCFWNVENLFDDKLNPKLEKVDREFDDYFAKDGEALAMKLQRLREVLLSKEMNNGRGPDILAMAEV